MGGVSIALDDPYLDPFINPGKGIRIRGAMLFVSPTYYTISGNNGSARTLPLGAVFQSGGYFGGSYLSLQQLDAANAGDFQPLLSRKSSGNIYAFGFLGTRLPNSDVSVGGSFTYAKLSAIDGVDQMYPRSNKIEQDGSMVDCRIGLLSERNGRAFEALLLHNRFSMTHDVSYWNGFWELDDFGPALPQTERNFDRSSTWGLHFGYVRPLSQTGWKIGGILTGNWKSHPKLPNYELMNIPRDPGNTKAYNIGLGMSKTSDRAVFGFDVVYEPIWCNTWADALEPVTSLNGRIIRPGEKTVENDFTFSNTVWRMGFSRESTAFGFQMGLAARSIKYSLDQYNYVEAFRRKQKEHWLECTASLGLILKFSEFNIQYLLRIITGTGQPGVAANSWMRTADASYGDFIPAPNGPLTLQEVVVLTHRITVVIPL